MKYKIFSGNPKQKKPKQNSTGGGLIASAPTPGSVPPPGRETGFIPRLRTQFVHYQSLQIAPDDITTTLREMQTIVDAARTTRDAQEAVPTPTNGVFNDLGDRVETATWLAVPAVATTTLADEIRLGEITSENLEDIDAEAAAAQME